MLIEFGRKDTAFLSNKGILRYVFLLFFKKILFFVSLFSFFFEKYPYICADKPLYLLTSKIIGKILWIFFQLSIPLSF